MNGEGEQIKVIFLTVCKMPACKLREVIYDNFKAACY